MKIIIFFSPLIILVEILIFGWIAELLRQPSDVAVLAGILLVSCFLIGNYFLIKLIQKQFKKAKK
jgi:hypothetical protein